MADETVLICARVVDLPEPTTGSVIRKCKDCLSPIWVGSESIGKVILAHGVAPLLVCLQCAQDAIRREGMESIIAETKRVGIGERGKWQ